MNQKPESAVGRGRGRGRGRGAAKETLNIRPPVVNPGMNMFAKSLHNIRTDEVRKQDEELPTPTSTWSRRPSYSRQSSHNSEDGDETQRSRKQSFDRPQPPPPTKFVNPLLASSSIDLTSDTGSCSGGRGRSSFSRQSSMQSDDGDRVDRRPSFNRQSSYNNNNNSYTRADRNRRDSDTTKFVNPLLASRQSSNDVSTDERRSSCDSSRGSDDGYHTNYNRKYSDDKSTARKFVNPLLAPRSPPATKDTSVTSALNKLMISTDLKVKRISKTSSTGSEKTGSGNSEECVTISDDEDEGKYEDVFVKKEVREWDQKKFWCSETNMWQTKGDRDVGWGAR